ncbi:type VI secretion system protein TssL, long form [Jiella sp. MQZ9-1]|uniref:Type VI secretion system protein TssL, long form n=1 Tax=Jiella flava TaxID=2816857 RepID=A0A939FW85_9HYPH|nr:type VI secretion system protein TssL, long form [Jiella flava]MBO0662667.1 type VI secretion system protein TssL, long form [Jiella flava]MCD2471089.1 type VI secretion system protein TssL, long form [Jiella flava]
MSATFPPTGDRTTLGSDDDLRTKDQRAPEVFDDLVESAPPFADGPPMAAPQRPQGGGWSPEVLLRSFRFGGSEVPVIVASAAPLLNLAHELRQRGSAPNIEELRPTVIEAVRRYERDLASARISPERARAAHYVICATIDDVILAQPWGERIAWARQGLVSTFHMDVTGGDRVFDLLDHFHQSPGANKDLLLLIYLCISLAFEGRTRVSARGALELERIRESLYRTLLGQFGVFERELSPHWRGVNARHKPLRTATVLWTLLALLALILGIGYLFFLIGLNRASDGTFSALASLPPNQAPSLAPPPPPPAPKVETVKAAPKTAPPPPKPTPPAKPQVSDLEKRLKNLMAFLQPEVEKGLVGLSNANGRLLVRISNAGLFDTGSADVNPKFQGLLQRIGGALASEDFKAVVVGYTDNVPIHTPEFPSNYDLSKARAKAVGDVLSQFTGPGQVTTEGRADSDPIASNDTPEGREKNRRTEILVMTDAANRLENSGAQAMGAPAPQQPAATAIPDLKGAQTALPEPSTRDAAPAAAPVKPTPTVPPASQGSAQ